MNDLRYGNAAAAAPLQSAVLIPRDVEACAPGTALVPGQELLLTWVAEEMRLDPGGIRILCPEPGDGRCVVSLLADGDRMTPEPTDLTGRRIRAVPPAGLRAGFRTLPPDTRLSLRVEAMAGYLPWRGLRVVFLPLGQTAGS